MHFFVTIFQCYHHEGWKDELISMVQSLIFLILLSTGSGADFMMASIFVLPQGNPSAILLSVKISLHIFLMICS